MKVTLRKVERARQYEQGVLEEKKDAKRMLIVQQAFPCRYAPVDVLMQKNAHEHFMSRDLQIMRCLLEHTGHGPFLLKTWLLAATEHEIFRFLIDLFEADPDRDWTGYRILVSTTKASRTWHFELFAKHPKSNTVVFTAPVVPNVGKL